MIFVAEFCACTKAPRKGAPSGALTAPATVAACASALDSRAREKALKNPAGFIALPPSMSFRECPSDERISSPLLRQEMTAAPAPCYSREGKGGDTHGTETSSNYRRF